MGHAEMQRLGHIQHFGSKIDNLAVCRQSGQGSAEQSGLQRDGPSPLTPVSAAGGAPGRQPAGPGAVPGGAHRGSADGGPLPRRRCASAAGAKAAKKYNVLRTPTSPRQADPVQAAHIIQELQSVIEVT